MTDPELPELVLAPIQGLTPAIFRNLFHEMFGGFDRAMAPFVSPAPGCRNFPRKLKDLLPENNSGMPVIPQIMGNDPDYFLDIAARIRDLGYREVNWNLGCPFILLVKKKKGAGLLPHPDLIDAFLAVVMPHLDMKLSIKIRLGLSDPREIETVLPVLDKFPLTEVIIHPRTGVQKYTGSPNLEAFARCLPLTRHPVMYSGDINSVTDFKRLTARFPSVSRWMIGRGAVANPFLPSEIRGKTGSADEKLQKFRAFHDELFRRYDAVLSGPSHITNRMKEYWFTFASSFENGRKHLKKIQKTQNRQHYQDVVNHFFDQDAVWMA